MGTKYVVIAQARHIDISDQIEARGEADRKEAYEIWDNYKYAPKVWLPCGVDLGLTEEYKQAMKVWYEGIVEEIGLSIQSYPGTRGLNLTETVEETVRIYKEKNPHPKKDANKK